MSTDDITGDPRFDGRPVDDWARSWEVPRVVAFTSVGSTMDVAHALAREGASDGTVVVADTQQAGRGRNGRPWRAPSGGLWCSVLLRPTAQQPFDGATLGVFTLRIGLSLAVVLDDVIGGASPAVRLKWPNDLWWSGGKLGGILTEAHWEGARLGWLVVGVGINRALPPGRGSTDLAPPIALPSALPRGTLLGVM
ncbi:MAG: biotin--[acetyl-CoA-carboxylase] ligase, partial [Gemmatimonadaceae bacterium]|nr:biotin--[acetyl-CoA-carboxylase] ligase [Gemmatimonadaceae bacterium]